MQAPDGRWLVISTIAWVRGVVSLPRRSTTAVEDGGRDIAWRLSSQFADWVRALATIAEATDRAELVHCLGVDRELPHMAGDAAPDTVVQTLAESAAKGKE